MTTKQFWVRTDAGIWIGRYANVLAAQAVADHYHNGEVVVFDD